MGASPVGTASWTGFEAAGTSMPGKVIVTILCDYGTRYQSKLFNAAFLREKGLAHPAWVEQLSA